MKVVKSRFYRPKSEITASRLATVRVWMIVKSYVILLVTSISM